jgi:hypothetical protein
LGLFFREGYDRALVVSEAFPCRVSIWRKVAIRNILGSVELETYGPSRPESDDHQGEPDRELDELLLLVTY